MAYEASLGEFHGPLDVLLGLALNGELDIEAARLSSLVQQYLEYLGEAADEPPHRLAEALLLLVKLVALKARRLVAPPDDGACAEPPEEEPDEDLLAQRLEEYNLYYQLRLALAERAESGLRSFIRLAPLPPPSGDRRIAPESASVALLVAALKRALAGAPSVAEPEEGPSLVERMAALRSALGAGTLRLNELFAVCASRLEIIVTFLALLELMRVGEARVRQERLFGEIVVQPGSKQQEGDGPGDVDADVARAGRAAGGEDLV
ncbi:MAG: hypothetical protein M1531_09580 [Chloroflexi bacterium]|nr:hypothetical protein [Chloroflexota bacterium]